MPPKINTPQGAPAPAPVAPSTAVSAAPREQPRPPPQQRQPTSDRDDEGVRREEGDSTEARGPSMGYPKWDSFTTPFPAGNATYVCSVQKIVKWPFGTMVTFRVEVGPERGRTFDWSQMQPQSLTGDKAAKWRSNLFGAYAAGGWPLDPDPSTKWPGWERNGAGVGVPPYDRMFVHTAPDGVQVPVALEVDTWTGTQASASGKDPTPFVNAVSHYVPTGSSLPVQAPMPYHLPEWLARRHRWEYTPDSIVTRNGSIAVAKVDYKQVPFNHGGLRTLRDLARGES